MYIDPQQVTIPLALLAGLLSFISPCVLPLVPAYIGYMSGQAANSLTAVVAATSGQSGSASTASIPSRWIVVLHGAAFVLGFSTVFVLLGMGVGALGQLARAIIGSSDWIGRIGGTLLIVMGLHTLGVIRIPFLYYDTRSQSAPLPELGLFGSFLMGITFSVGWSPCLGPILSAILGLGLRSESVGNAAMLLAAYSLGLGIPFMLSALLIDQASAQIKALRQHMRKVEIVSGILLIGIGLLVFFGQIQSLSSQLSSLTGLTEAIDTWLIQISGGGQP
jgi:cytochrome c-type biogenesis protein